MQLSRELSESLEILFNKAEITALYCFLYTVNVIKHQHLNACLVLPQFRRVSNGLSMMPIITFAMYALKYWRITKPKFWHSPSSWTTQEKHGSDRIMFGVKWGTYLKVEIFLNSITAHYCFNSTSPFIYWPDKSPWNLIFPDIKQESQGRIQKENKDDKTWPLSQLGWKLEYRTVIK